MMNYEIAIDILNSSSEIIDHDRLKIPEDENKREILLKTLAMLAEACTEPNEENAFKYLELASKIGSYIDSKIFEYNFAAAVHYVARRFT